MTFDPDMLGIMGDALEAAGLTGPITLRTMAGGILSLPSVPFRASVTADDKSESFDGRQTRIVRRLIVRPLDRPMVAPAGTVPMVAQLGDKVTYKGAEFSIVALGGADLPRWTCEEDDPIGTNKDGAFHAEGRA